MCHGNCKCYAVLSHTLNVYIYVAPEPVLLEDLDMVGNVKDKEADGSYIFMCLYTYVSRVQNNMQLAITNF